MPTSPKDESKPDLGDRHGRDHAISVGSGGVAFGTGALGMIGLAAWAGTTTPSLFREGRFVALFIALGVITLAGFYAVVNPYTGWPMPPVRSDSWRPWQVFSRFRLKVSITTAPSPAEAQITLDAAMAELNNLKAQCMAVCGDGSDPSLHEPHREVLAAAYAKFSAAGRVLAEAIDGPPKPLPVPTYRSDLPNVSRASLTMTAGPTVPGSRTYRVKFDTSMSAGQAIPLPFRPTGLLLIEPTPVTEDVATGPHVWNFRDGKVVIHEITDTGFSVEVRPADLVVVVEIDAYGSPV